MYAHTAPAANGVKYIICDFQTPSFHPPTIFAYFYIQSMATVSSSLGQNGCHFADIFKHILFNKNARISIQISLEFVPKGPID